MFYNQSGTATRYDGNNLAINSFDDNAIATDKTAYLWEDTGAATFANVSSYTKGINGIMVDISGSHPSITASDFIFRVGNNNSPGTWATIGATSVSVRAGAGMGGSDRVEIIWTSGAAIKQWLEVITLANANTGLPQKAGYPVGQGDAFFFGNAVGDTRFGRYGHQCDGQRHRRERCSDQPGEPGSQHSDHEHLRLRSECPGERE